MRNSSIFFNKECHWYLFSGIHSEIEASLDQLLWHSHQPWSPEHVLSQNRLFLRWMDKTFPGSNYSLVENSVLLCICIALNGKDYNLLQCFVYNGFGYVKVCKELIKIYVFSGKIDRRTGSFQIASFVTYNIAFTFPLNKYTRIYILFNYLQNKYKIMKWAAVALLVFSIVRICTAIWRVAEGKSFPSFFVVFVVIRKCIL